MSYLNDQVGYREELLATRSVIKKENYVLLEPDGLVRIFHILEIITLLS